MTGSIGIALAAYNPDLDQFYEQLRSIHAQTFKKWICQISCDSSLSPVRDDRRFEVFFSDPRFRWYENPIRLGHLKNFERTVQALTETGVDAIAFCDQDDIWYPEKLEISLNELATLGPNGLVFCDMNLMDESGIISHETAWKAERRGVGHCSTYDLLVRNVVPGTGLLMDARLAKKFPEIPEKAVYHDHWYPLLASRLGRIKAIQKPLYAYRIHSKNVAGLSRYTGLFSRKSSDRGPAGLIAKCRSVWSRSSELARAAEREGLELSLLQKISFLLPWDLGVCLGVYGMFRLFSDPALARACFARALGKFSECLRFSREFDNQ